MKYSNYYVNSESRGKREMEEKVARKPESSGRYKKIAAMIIGLVIALIVTGIMRSKLKSVRHKVAASDYVRPGSMHVTVRRDFYLYRTVSRRPKPKSSGGSSGSRRSGGGGSF